MRKAKMRKTKQSWIHFGSDLREAQVNTKCICATCDSQEMQIFVSGTSQINSRLYYCSDISSSFPFTSLHDLYVRGW